MRCAHCQAALDLCRVVGWRELLTGCPHETVANVASQPDPSSTYGTCGGLSSWFAKKLDKSVLLAMVGTYRGFISNRLMASQSRVLSHACACRFLMPPFLMGNRKLGS